MNAPTINLCLNCLHINACVLTTLKELVFSCSEFDEIKTDAGYDIHNTTQSELELT
ncbi:MAG: hypothetical protein KBT58_07070 [Bizionia sp.]|nr:hypothetical protein [Bizionia sp.]